MSKDVMLFRSTVVGLVLLVVGPDALACERNEYGVFEDSSCASAAFADAQKKMDDAYQRLLTEVSPEARDALKVSQDMWEQYRQSVANFTYAQEGDGSAGRHIVMNDQERAMRARTKSCCNGYRGSKNIQQALAGDARKPSRA